MKTMKHKWSEKDFDIMNWYDNRLYSITFDTQSFKIAFDIDYILEWANSLDSFLVAPCKLNFENVHNIVINIDFGNTQNIIINKILRENNRKTPNENFTEWFYVIETDVGNISFWATGFIQMSNLEPIWHGERDLNRKPS